MTHQEQAFHRLVKQTLQALEVFAEETGIDPSILAAIAADYVTVKRLHHHAGKKKENKQ